MMSPEDIVSAFRNAGVTDATLNNEGQLVFPSGITLSGTNYLGF